MAKIGNTALKALLDGGIAGHKHKFEFNDAFDSFADELESFELDITVNAEASNAITVDLQVVERDGEEAVSSAKTYLAELVDANLDPTTPGSGQDIAETGDGTEVSATAQDKLLFTTSAAGAAQLTVTDQSAALAATLYLLLTPVGHDGPVQYTAVTFA